MADKNSGDKSYDATPYSLSQKREKGIFPVSKDIAISAQMLVVSVMIALFFTSGIEMFVRYFSIGVNANSTPSTLIYYIFSVYTSAIWPIATISLASILIFYLAQTKFSIQTDKVSVGANFQKMFDPKRMFSQISLSSVVKNLLRIIFTGIVFYYFISNTLPWIISSINNGDNIFSVIGGSIYPIWVIAVLFLLIGVIDLVSVRHKFIKESKMTRDEVEDEQKTTESPLIVRKHIRDIISRGGKNRGAMILEVPRSTVIITNPTHIAVALFYEQSMIAPVVVAKGVDEIAFQIKQIGIENRVPIRENPPLARALYDSCDIGSQIPEKLYSAVVEIMKPIFLL